MVCLLSYALLGIAGCAGPNGTVGHGAEPGRSCLAQRWTELDAHGEPSALFIIRKWRAQKLEDEERNLLQERLFTAEEHFRCMSAEGRDSNIEAEAHYRRMKNARAELVCRCEQCISQFILTCVLIF